MSPSSRANAASSEAEMGQDREAGNALERIRLLDVLRGMAIFGTLGSNIWLFSTVAGGGSEVFGGGAPWWSSAESLLTTLTLFLTNGKFLGLLTILFGVGLEIQYRSAMRRGLRWPVRYLWRSALLLVEGLLHYLLVFEFDILMGYAVAAFIAAFVVGKSERTIRRVMWIAGGLHVALFGMASVVLFVLLVSANADTSIGAFGQEAARVYISGSWWDQVLYRADNIFIYRLEPVLIVPLNIFLFLAGVRLMRSGAFSSDSAGRTILRKMLFWGLVLGIPLNLLYLVPGGLFWLPVRYLFAPVLSIGYLGLVALLVERNLLPWLSNRAAEVGRMALSCYVVQNILASIVFYGWGFGLSGEIGASGTLLVFAGICGTLALLSNLWLRYFEQGPFEAVWRRLSLLPFNTRGDRSY